MIVRPHTSPPISLQLSPTDRVLKVYRLLMLVSDGLQLDPHCRFAPSFSFRCLSPDQTVSLPLYHSLLAPIYPPWSQQQSDPAAWRCRVVKTASSCSAATVTRWMSPTSPVFRSRRSSTGNSSNLQGISGSKNARLSLHYQRHPHPRMHVPRVTGTSTRHAKPARHARRCLGRSVKAFAARTTARASSGPRGHCVAT